MNVFKKRNQLRFYIQELTMKQLTIFLTPIFYILYSSLYYSMYFLLFSYSFFSYLFFLFLLFYLPTHPGGLWFFWLFEVCVFSPSGGVFVRLVGALSFCYWFSFFRCVPSGAGILGFYFGTFREQLGKRSSRGRTVSRLPNSPRL